MDIPVDDYEVAQAPPPKPKPVPIPKEPPQTCKVSEAIQTILGDRTEECLAWSEANYNYRYLLKEVRPLEYAKSTAEHVIKGWETACESRAKWGNIDIPTLSSDDPITVGDLHAHLSEILAAHPDFAAVPIHHEECHGNRETGCVEFLIEEGILVLS